MMSNANDRAEERASLTALPSLLFLGALVAFFLGERAAWSETGRWILSGGAGLLVLAAFGLKAKAFTTASQRARQVIKMGMAGYGAGVFGALLYFVSLGSESADAAQVIDIAAEATRAPTLLFAAGIFFLIASLACVVSIEISSTSMRAAGFAEPRRVTEAAGVALTLTVAVASAVALNFTAVKRDIRTDLSSSSPAKLSDSTMSLVQASQIPVEIFLFFERGSPMLPELQDFYAPMVDAGAKLTALDHALDPVLAKEMKISRTGTVGFRVGERTEKWFVGTARDALSRKLKRADEETRVRLSRITRDEKHIYFTVGHGERPDRKAKKGERLGGESLRKVARALNATMKKLGFAEGLGRDVPDDASLVVVFGPSRRFLPEEQASLIRYLQGGGSLALFLDPFVEHGLDELLRTLHVKMPPEEVVNDREFVRQSHNAADHAIIFSNSFASHATTKTLKGTRGRASVLMASAGRLERTKKSDRKKGDAKKEAVEPDGESVAFGQGPPRITFTMRSRPSSFVDVKRNRTFDASVEKRRVLNLAEVFEQKIDAATSARALVVADSDAFADGLIPNEANQVFAYEGFGWLVHDDGVGGSLNLDEDAPIRHTNEEDVLVFYATTGAGPIFVGILGFVVLSRRKRRRNRAKESS